MLLEYALGDEHSYLWAVTSDSLRSYELAGRKTIEDAARELYRLTTARQVSEQTENYQAQIEKADNAYLETATRLSQMLLGPVADELADRRILVVTEGALQHISLEALPVPVGKDSSIGKRFRKTLNRTKRSRCAAVDFYTNRASQFTSA